MPTESDNGKLPGTSKESASTTDGIFEKPGEPSNSYSVDISDPLPEKTDSITSYDESVASYNKELKPTLLEKSCERKGEISRCESPVHQGDILKNFTYDYYISDTSGKEVLRTMWFPLVVVISQDCDLTQDYDKRKKLKFDDKGCCQVNNLIFSSIVAPMYNFHQFLDGSHLSNFKWKMQSFSKNSKDKLTNLIKTNQIGRYYYLSFENSVIVDSVIDFKHTLAIDPEILRETDRTDVRIPQPYREEITRKYADYISRIGTKKATIPLDRQLPDEETKVGECVDIIDDEQKTEPVKSDGAKIN